MQKIHEMLKQASEILAKPDIRKAERHIAISLMKAARDGLDTEIATLESRQRTG